MSKILISGDWHIRAINPLNRIGEYKKQQFDKIKWILDLAEKEKCVAIIQPGDFFDNRKMPEDIKVRYIELFKRFDTPILTIYGQHDLRYHKNKRNTAMAVLESSGVITILNEDAMEIDDGVHIYGASWEEKFPEVVDTEALNILVLHKMVIEDEPLWPGQKSFTRKNVLLRKETDFDIFCCGDNHNTFYHNEDDEKLFFNMGSLMRSNIAQVDHKPTIALYDYENGETEIIEVPILPATEVLKIEDVENLKRQDSAFTAFAELLDSDTKEIGINFEQNVKQLSVEAKLKTVEEDSINQYIGEYYEEKEANL